ncbi:hypothetical protein BJ878DRAFT_317351 [Calycina marina]|uniref:Integral membrane protein n=1 Tax=Calycina marina TaxID=1763456 RepID=A0A9P7YUN1_9HELO|nr:hypothetical protein BJ878DRAFT_317351 [Calycina marina]
MIVLNARVENLAPVDYDTPGFPSLYWPYGAKTGESNYLYYTDDIMRYTLYWTLIIYAIFHVSAAGYAVLMQIGKGKSVWKYAWAILGAYMIIAGVQAVMAGCFVGLILGAVYNAGYLRMSTWIPLLWSVINVLVLIVSSFSIHGGL